MKNAQSHVAGTAVIWHRDPAHLQVVQNHLFLLEAFFPPGEVPLSVSQKFPSSNLQLPLERYFSSPSLTGFPPRGSGVRP